LRARGASPLRRGWAPTWNGWTQAAPASTSERRAGRAHSCSRALLHDVPPAAMA
jgi:hypothetical protein